MWNAVRNTENFEKNMRKTHFRTKKMERKLNNVKNETQTLFDLDYGKKHWKNGKWEMHTLGPGIWRENWKSWKMKINTVGSEIWRETPKNVKNEKQNLFDLEYGEKQWKRCKMRNAHCRTWNMARKRNIVENEKHTLMKYVVKPWKTWKKINTHCRTWIMARKLKNLENEKHTL